MRNAAKSWVVYVTSADSKVGALNAVCEQAEWDAMELQRPGYHTLVRSGIASEAEAEKAARAGLVAAEAAEVEQRKRRRAARTQLEQEAG